MRVCVLVAYAPHHVSAVEKYVATLALKCLVLPIFVSDLNPKSTPLEVARQQSAMLKSRRFFLKVSHKGAHKIFRFASWFLRGLLRVAKFELELTFVTPLIRESLTEVFVRSLAPAKVVLVDDGLSTYFDQEVTHVGDSPVTLFTKYAPLMEKNRDVFREPADHPANLTTYLTGTAAFFGSPIVEAAIVTGDELIMILGEVRRKLSLDRIQYFPHRREAWHQSFTPPAWLEFVETNFAKTIDYLNYENCRPQYFVSFFSSTLVDIWLESGVEQERLKFYSLVRGVTQSKRNSLYLEFRNVGRIEQLFRKLEFGEMNV